MNSITGIDLISKDSISPNLRYRLNNTNSLNMTTTVFKMFYFRLLYGSIGYDFKIIHMKVLYHPVLLRYTSMNSVYNQKTTNKISSVHIIISNSLNVKKKID